MPEAPLVLRFKNDDAVVRAGLAQAFQVLTQQYTTWDLVSMTTHHPPRQLSSEPNYRVVIYTICYKVR